MTNEQTTGDDGKATFQLEYGDYTATITKDGYVTKTENIAFRSNHKNFSITLEEDTPTGTGTVTVTCVNEATDPITEVHSILLYTGEMPTPQQDSNLVAYGSNGEGNVATLYLWDTTTHQLTDDPNIPFGTYNIFADGLDENENSYNYMGTLTVDGDETVTITLTKQE